MAATADAAVTRLATRSRGFSLVELAIGLLVLAILAALAWPSYREQVARSRRADVQVALMEGAQYMQRFYAANNAFDGGPPAARLPVTVSPRDGPRAYDLSVAAVTATTYLLVATRTAGGPMALDRCGDFTLAQDGTRGLANQASGIAPAMCWR